MARIKGPKKTKRYPDEFKIKAVQLADHPDIFAKGNRVEVWGLCTMGKLPKWVECQAVGEQRLSGDRYQVSVMKRRYQGPGVGETGKADAKHQKYKIGL